MQTYAVVVCDGESGRIIGSNYLDQRDEVAAIGAATRPPFTAPPFII